MSARSGAVTFHEVEARSIAISWRSAAISRASCPDAGAAAGGSGEAGGPGEAVARAAGGNGYQNSPADGPDPHLVL